MSFQKQTITDAYYQYPSRFTLKNVQTNTELGVFDLSRVRGAVQAEGTEINAALLQRYEDALSDSISTYHGTTTDLNTALSHGIYTMAPGTSNSPGSFYGIIENIVSDGTTHNNSTNWIWQYVRSVNDPCALYLRVKVNNGSWSGWSSVGASSPYFTGTPTAPTAAVGTNTTQIATCAYVLAATIDGGTF